MNLSQAEVRSLASRLKETSQALSLLQVWWICVYHVQADAPVALPHLCLPVHIALLDLHSCDGTQPGDTMWHLLAAFVSLQAIQQTNDMDLLAVGGLYGSGVTGRQAQG